MSAREHCESHSGVCKQLEQDRADIAKLWEVVGKRTPLWAFILLVTLVVGGLGFQFKIYEKIAGVEKDVAVIKATIKGVE